MYRYDYTNIPDYIIITYSATPSACLQKPAAKESIVDYHIHQRLKCCTFFASAKLLLLKYGREKKREKFIIYVLTFINTPPAPRYFAFNRITSSSFSFISTPHVPQFMPLLHITPPIP
uniref:Uncharacterized protein n=1 Tax=Cacopsylla melanoneura TaxID=428564 RepID=A0A8D9B5N4_9HEMI